MHACIDRINSGGGNQVYSLINLFSGGALLQLSVFAIGIMPYITASIIVQLLTVVIPRFEELKKEGQSGQTKMTQYTRYLTIGLALLQSSTLVAGAVNAPYRLIGGTELTCPTITTDSNVPTMIIMVLVLTAGTGLIMWLGELITEKGPTGFTLSEAAKQAGVTPAAVYRHFEGRDDLIAEAALQGYEIFADEAALDAALDLVKGWSPANREAARAMSDQLRKRTR